MKKVVFFITSFFVLLSLTGCEQTVFGVPKDQWDQLSPQQQSQIIEGYNQRQQTEAQNAPIMAAIGAASSILKKNTTDPSDTTAAMATGPSIKAPDFPSPSNILAHSSCTAQANTTNCNYAGPQSSH